MATIKAAVAALERYGGFDPKRCRTISRALIDNGVIPMGAPGMAQVLSVEEFLFFLETVAFDPLLREARETAARAQFLVPDGVDLTGAPASIPRTAHEALLVEAEMALAGLGAQRAVTAARFEFVHNWPEIAIHHSGRVARFVEPGASHHTWQVRGRRTATTVSLVRGKQDNGQAAVRRIRQKIEAAHRLRGIR